MIMAMKISSNEKMLTGLRNSGYKFFQMICFITYNSFVLKSVLGLNFLLSTIKNHVFKHQFLHDMKEMSNKSRGLVHF